MTRKILIVGGTGVFGSRLATDIVATTEFDVIVAGRDERRCEAFIAQQDVSARVRLSVAIMDTSTVTAHELVMTGAFIVIDAAGPYQGQELCLPRAAVEAKMHYLDFADGHDFVGGIAALDAAARFAGVTILAGASPTPALITAGLDELVSGWQQVDVVAATILPGNRAPRGRSVVRSILFYAGRPVHIFMHGAWCSTPGWGLTRRLEIGGLCRRWPRCAKRPTSTSFPHASTSGVRRFSRPVCNSASCTSACSLRAEALTSLGIKIEAVWRCLHCMDALGRIYVGIDCAIDIWRQTLGKHGLLGCWKSTPYAKWHNGAVTVSLAGFMPGIAAMAIGKLMDDCGCDAGERGFTSICYFSHLAKYFNFTE